MSIIFHLNVLRHYCVSRFNRWRAGLVGPKFVLGVKAKTHTARGKPMAMLHFFFFKSTTKLKFRRGSIYIYIYISLSLSSIKLLISQEEQLCFKPLGQEDYSCLFFSFILFKRSNKDGYLTGVIYALFLTRMGRRWQLGP